MTNVKRKCYAISSYTWENKKSFNMLICINMVSWTTNTSTDNIWKYRYNEIGWGLNHLFSLSPKSLEELLFLKC